MNLGRLALVLALVPMIACEEEEEEGKLTPPNPMFTAADLAAGSYNAIDEDEVLRDLGSKSIWYDIDTGSALVGDTQGCITAKLGTVKVQADKANLTINGTADLTSCFEEAGTTIEAVSAKLLFYIGCPKSDLSNYNGKTLAEVSQMSASSEPCKVEDTGSRMESVGIDVSLNSDGVEVSANIREAMQTEDGKPCQISFSNNSWLWADSCRAWDHTVYSKLRYQGTALPDEGKGDFLKVTYNGIRDEDSASARYYAGGYFSLAYNNWTGTVNYTSSTAQPTFSITDGTTTINGEVSLTLRTQAPADHSERIRRQVMSVAEDARQMGLRLAESAR